MLARLEPSDVEKALQGGESGDRHDRRLVEGEVRRLAGELVLAGGRVLGEGASADPEDLVADFEPGHVRTDRHDRAGDVEPEHGVLGFAEAGAHEAEQVGHAGHEVPGAAVHPGRVHANQHLVGADGWPVDLLDAENVGGAVLVPHDRLHPLLGWRRRGGFCAVFSSRRSPTGSASCCLHGRPFLGGWFVDTASMGAADAGRPGTLARLSDLARRPNRVCAPGVAGSAARPGLPRWRLKRSSPPTTKMTRAGHPYAASTQLTSRPSIRNWAMCGKTTARPTTLSCGNRRSTMRAGEGRVWSPSAARRRPRGRRGPAHRW